MLHNLMFGGLRCFVCNTLLATLLLCTSDATLYQMCL
jgi:hypothetical protein